MLTLNELNELLDPKNPRTESLLDTFKLLQDLSQLTVEHKKEGLLELVRHLGDKRLYPVVDKKLKLVFAVNEGGHAVLMQELFRYHYHADDPELRLPCIGVFLSRDRYVTDRHGYFISSNQPDMIVVSEKYRHDKYDDDLFANFDLDQL